MTLTLPTEKVAPTTINPRLMFLYGLPKVGKTSILSQLDNCLILDLEKGSSFLEALKLEINSLNDLITVGKKIVDGGLPYKYIAIDVVDKLEEWCEAEATEDYKNTVMGKHFDGKSVLELPQGAGYYWLRKTFFKYLDAIQRLAPTIILVGHVKEKQIEKQGKEVSAKDIQLTGKIKSITASRCDAIVYLYRNNGNKLMFTTETRDEVTCGSRSEHLKGVTDEFSWDKIFI